VKEKIKYAEFNLLDIQQKIDIIDRDGSLVIAKHGRHQRKTQYQVSTFIAEVTTNKKGVKHIKTISAK